MKHEEITNKAEKWFFNNFLIWGTQFNNEIESQLDFVFPNSPKEDKKRKQFEKILFNHILDFKSSYTFSFIQIFKKTEEFVNNLKIEAVVLSYFSGSINSRIPSILILENQNIHIFIDTPLNSAMGLFGLIASIVKEKAKPYRHEIYPINEFLETIFLGDVKTINLFDGWSTFYVFKKFLFTGVYRPAIQRLIELGKINLSKISEASKTKENENSDKNNYILDNTEIELAKLKELFEKRLITQEEYDLKRKKILGL
jgi:hypothetical protein